MEIVYTTVAVVCCVVISLQAWKLFKWAWLDPKHKEKLLRQQGFYGNSYKFLIGDYKEISKAKQAQSQPIPFSNDISERVSALFYDALKKYGENCFVWLGPKPTVIISDPEMIKEIFSRNYVFQKLSTPLNELIARGVAEYDTDKWAKHRRLLNPAFHLEKVKNMLPAFYLSCADLLSKWEKIVPRDGSVEVDVWPYLQTLTSDAISRTAFGSNYEEGRKIFALQREQGILLMKTLTTFLIPGWRFLPTKANRRMKEIARLAESSILGIINKRIKAIEAGEVDSDDLLSVLLESNFREIQENGSESGMSFYDVVEECKLFYIAGQTTTSTLLVWTMILLGKHLDWQARARDEVQQLFADGKLPDFQELNHLKVVTMILHEVLRLYPPGVFLLRRTDSETKLKDITLPGDVQILVPVVMLHHDRNMWGPDADEFNPERFSEGISKATRGQFIYLPFGAGPRICIGQSFAMLEAKLALAMILRHYSFTVSPSYAHAPESVLSLEPQYGAQLIMSRI